MNITLNGQQIETQQITLEALLQEQGYDDCTVATAVSGQFVPVKERANLTLQEGAIIEVVAPMQGG